MGRAAQLQLDATVVRHPQPFLREGSPQPVAAEVEQGQPDVLVGVGPGLEGIPVELHREPAGGALLLQWPWQACLERLGLQVRQRILRVGLLEQSARDEHPGGPPDHPLEDSLQLLERGGGNPDEAGRAAIEGGEGSVGQHGMVMEVGVELGAELWVNEMAPVLGLVAPAWRAFRRWKRKTSSRNIRREEAAAAQLRASANRTGKG
jgi:hypothetical protein